MDKIKKEFETDFDIPDYLAFDGEDYMYYEEDPVLREQCQDIQSKWRGFRYGYKSREDEIKKLRDALLMYEPWSLIDITKKLLEAADILLHKYDYDGDCWEQIQEAWERGNKALKEPPNAL